LCAKCNTVITAMLADPAKRQPKIEILVFAQGDIISGRPSLNDANNRIGANTIDRQERQQKYDQKDEPLQNCDERDRGSFLIPASHRCSSQVQ
jgi:hypothetical protein